MSTPNPPPPLNYRDWEAAARDRLPAMVYDYYAGGAHDEITLAENRTALDALRLHGRVLRDMSRRSPVTTLLGEELAFPLVVAPTALHEMACPEGEAATARAAGAAGVPLILSTLSNVAVEEVCAATSGPVWFQLYVQRDRDRTARMVERAVQAGCSALVLTVDAQTWGIRERDERNSFRMPEGLVMRNLAAAEASGRFPEVEGSGLAAYVTENFDTTLDEKGLEWLVETAGVPVLVKGILRADDARRAVDHGAAGVMVSNHGGRQLDTAPASLEVLPAVAAALRDSGVPVLVDGGIRRGTDIIKALARGAHAVAVGRPVLWGLAVEGEAGVARVLATFHDEFDRAMALCGARSVEEITPDLLSPPPPSNP